MPPPPPTTKGKPAQKAKVDVCGICDETHPLLAISSLCNHEPKYCEGCLFNTAKEEINGKGGVNVRCPHCPITIKSDELMILIKKDKTLSDRVDNLLLIQFLRADPNFCYCANPRGCGSGCSLIDGAAAVNFFTCRDCNSTTCVSHKLPWHSGLTCAEFDQRIKESDTESEAWQHANTKKCPGCTKSIEHAGGCNVMACCTYGDDTCRRLRTGKGGPGFCDHGGLCGQRFCWICLGLIDQDGTRHHTRQCQFNFDEV